MIQPDMFAQPKASCFDQEFETEFWPAYPRKVAKEAARKAFNKIRKTASLPAIMDMLATRKIEWAMNKRICFTPHASSFLHAESFTEPQTAPSKPIHESWRGMRAQIEKQLRAGEFEAWFGPEIFEAGPPPTILCATKFRAAHIEQRFRFPLIRALGEGVRVRAR